MLEVSVGGVVYSNWTSWSIDRDLLQPTDTFRLEVGDPSPDQVRAITEGEGVVIRLRDTTILKGFVDQVDWSGSRQGTRLSFSGRSAAAPLVDCSIPLQSSWSNVTLAGLASQLLTALGLSLTVQADADASKNLSWVKADPGETYWELLSRLARRARLMIWETAGVLRIGRPDYTGAPVGTLMWTSARCNVLEAAVTWQVSGRRHPVWVVGQTEDDERVQSKVSDPVLVAMGRVRPLVVVDSGVDRSSTAKARAELEVSRRAGEARVMRYTIPALGPTETSVWSIDSMVAVDDERISITDALWVSAISSSLGREGVRTTLTLRVKDAILPEVA